MMHAFIINQLYKPYFSINTNYRSQGHVGMNYEYEDAIYNDLSIDSFVIYIIEKGNLAKKL